VPVRVFTEKTGEGRTVLRRRAIVVNSSLGDWSRNETLEGLFASEHCLCPGCNGTLQGTCTPCVPLTPNCDVQPPEFKCWATIYKPVMSQWAYKIDVERVRFQRDYATVINWDIVISLIVFGVLGLLLLIFAVVLQIPQQIFGEAFRSNPNTAPLGQVGASRKRVGPW